jgi:hypothetical protein
MKNIRSYLQQPKFEKIKLGFGKIKKFIFMGGFAIPFLILLFTVAGYAGWQVTYIPKASCNLCHNIQPYVTSYYNSDYEDHLHQEANVICKECHKAGLFDVLDEAVAYITNDYRNPMRETKLSQEYCLQCHRSYDSLIAQTDNLVPNPHDPPHFEEPECSECHKSHRETILLCEECHEFDFDNPQAEITAKHDVSPPGD